MATENFYKLTEEEVHEWADKIRAEYERICARDGLVPSYWADKFYAPLRRKYPLAQKPSPGVR